MQAGSSLAEPCNHTLHSFPINRRANCENECRVLLIAKHHERAVVIRQVSKHGTAERSRVRNIAIRSPRNQGVIVINVNPSAQILVFLRSRGINGRKANPITGKHRYCIHVLRNSHSVRTDRGNSALGFRNAKHRSQISTRCRGSCNSNRRISARCSRSEDETARNRAICARNARNCRSNGVSNIRKASCFRKINARNSLNRTAHRDRKSAIRYSLELCQSSANLAALDISRNSRINTARNHKGANSLLLIVEPGKILRGELVLIRVCAEVFSDRISTRKTNSHIVNRNKAVLGKQIADCFKIGCPRANYTRKDVYQPISIDAHCFLPQKLIILWLKVRIAFDQSKINGIKEILRCLNNRAHR